MSLSRRAFLGTVAGTCLGMTGAVRADIRRWNRQRVEDAVAEFSAQSAAAADEGYLDQPAASIDDEIRSPQAPYCPQAGDIVFSRSKCYIYRIGHRLAGAGEPSHSGIVWQRPDGSFALLEAGLFDVPIIESIDLIPHLTAYNGRGHVWIRQRCSPLSPDQICKLAEFAQRQENKPFARIRLIGQITPFRSRGPLRTCICGRSHGPNRFSYYCAELVTEALIYAGEVDADDARPCATYPCDLFFNDSKVPFLKEHFKLNCWRPPQRWRPCLQ